jgi:hypothetical protein
MDYFYPKKVKLLKHIIGSVIGFMLFLVFVFAVNDNIFGKIEGYFFPVTQTTVFRISPSEDDVYDKEGVKYIKLQGELNKLRACAFVRMEAVVTDLKDHQTVAEIYFLEDEKIRHIGKQPWGPWLIRMPFDDIVRRNQIISITAYHSCHPGWLTVTKFR